MPLLLVDAIDAELPRRARVPCKSRTARIDAARPRSETRLGPGSSLKRWVEQRHGRRSARARAHLRPAFPGPSGMSGSAAILGRRLRPATLYPHARGSVLVPLALFGLPETIEADGETWALKEEFHVTAAHTPWLAERAGVTLDRAWEELAAALADRRVGLVRVGDELRRARKDDERTILVMVHVDGLTDLYSDLSRRLGPSL